MAAAVAMPAAFATPVSVAVACAPVKKSSTLAFPHAKQRGRTWCRRSRRRARLKPSHDHIIRAKREGPDGTRARRRCEVPELRRFIVAAAIDLALLQGI